MSQDSKLKNSMDFYMEQQLAAQQLAADRYYRYQWGSAGSIQGYSQQLPNNFEQKYHECLAHISKLEIELKEAKKLIEELGTETEYF